MKTPRLRCGVRAFPFMVFLGCLLIFSGCNEKKPVSEQKPLEPVQVQKPKPDNLVICIDNSKSIKGQEQILIRETTMLLADLADLGDRISVVTFGKEASLAASTRINTDDDRIAFKNKVQQRVNFNEHFSDIRKALRLLAKAPDSPVLQDGYVPHIIVLSDGKLEPADRKTRDAFEEILKIRQKELAETSIYAVVLGDTSCKDVILRNVDGKELDGKSLMRRYIASSEDHFFHAQNMNHLLDIGVDILTKIKGISAIGKQAQANQFKIDDSVETMTLVVRKRSRDGTILCNSSDILLNQPVARPNSRQSIYKSTKYQHFDLIVVRNPDEGIWSVTLANGKEPEVLSKIVTTIELRSSYRSRYYLNETALIKAWVFDRKNAAIVRDQRYQLKAHLLKAANLNPSNLYLPLHRDAETGQHFLEVPGELLAGLDMGRKPVKLEMEVVAERSKEGTAEMDPWFFRETPAFSVEFVEPFIEWGLQGERLIKLPFVKKDLIFGAALKASHTQRPEFELPPKLEIEVERFDKKANAFTPLFKTSIEPKAEKDALIYRNVRQMKSLDSGMYRYQYDLKGIVKLAGPFEIKSPGYLFEVQSFSYDSWWFWGAAGLVLFIAICMTRSLTAKIQGTLTIEGKKQILHTKTYHSEPNYANQFTLKAKRRCLLSSGIILTVTRGKVVVDDKQVLTQGQKVRLMAGVQHKIYHDEAGKKVERRLMAGI